MPSVGDFCGGGGGGVGADGWLDQECQQISLQGGGGGGALGLMDGSTGNASKFHYSTLSDH